MAEAANVLANFGVCVCVFFLPLNSEWPRLSTFRLIFFSHLCSQDDDWENWD